MRVNLGSELYCEKAVSSSSDKWKGTNPRATAKKLESIGKRHGTDYLEVELKLFAERYVPHAHDCGRMERYETMERLREL